MPYIYEVSLDIPSDQMDELAVGRSLERVLGYLRALLPDQHGYMTSRAMYTIGEEEPTRLVFLSEWGSWDALRSHRDSALLEDKVIAEFGPKIGAAGIGKRTYVEVGPEPY